MTIAVGSRAPAGRKATVWIAASALATVYAGSLLPTPLYLDYRRAFGFSEIVLTLVYGSYAIGNLAALFLLGRLSDQVGRRSVTLFALALAAVSTLLYGFAAGTVWLFAARIVSGLAIGIGAGTLTAWIVEVRSDGERATVLTAAFNMAGLGAGAIAAGVLSGYGPWPRHFVFFLYLGALAVAGMLVAVARETIEGTTHPKDVCLLPRIGVPKEIRLAFVSPAATIFASFALVGFYAALAPGLLGTALHQSSNAVVGAIVGELFVAGTATVLLSSALRSRQAAFTGLSLLFPSVVLLVLSQALASMPLLLVGTACSGAAAALGYRGSLSVINEISPKERRAEVVSSYLVAAYAGNSIPVIGVGALSRLTGSPTANAAFGAAVCILAAGALFTGARFSGASNR